jgi:hypothetical protein
MNRQHCSARFIVQTIFGIFFTPVFYVVVRWFTEPRSVADHGTPTDSLLEPKADPEALPETISATPH